MRMLKVSTPLVVGPDVAAWQRFLASRGLFQGTVDGKFGQATANSTMAYQRLVCLPIDGAVGEQTATRAKADGFSVPVQLVQAPAAPDNGPSFDTLAGVVLSATMRPIVEGIAHDFLAQTGHRLTVTSGTRNPESQAEAMRIKIELGDDLNRLYTNKQAVQEIIAAHKCASPAAREQAIAQTIRNQMSRGVFISRHLSGKGVDFRHLNNRDFKVFANILDDYDNLRLIREGKPPHIHVQLEDNP